MSIENWYAHAFLFDVSITEWFRITSNSQRFTPVHCWDVGHFGATLIIDFAAVRCLRDLKTNLHSRREMLKSFHVKIGPLRELNCWARNSLPNWPWPYLPAVIRFDRSWHGRSNVQQNTGGKQLYILEQSKLHRLVFFFLNDDLNCERVHARTHKQPLFNGRFRCNCNRLIASLRH